MVGYTLDELRKMDVQSLTHPDDLVESGRLLGEALARDPGSFNWEKRYVRSDGAVVNVRASISIARGVDRQPLHIVGIFEDISERTSVEAELRHSQFLLEIAGRVAKVGGWSIDLPERRLSWSDVVAAIHDEPAGFSPSLDQGLDSFAPESSDVIRSAVERCIADGTPYDLEVEKVSARGRRFWARTMGEAERDANGRIVRIQGAFQEITERKRAEEAIRESEERFSGAFEHAPIGVALVSPDGRWLKVNRAVCELVGYSEAELLAHSFQDITHPEDLEADLANVRRLIAGEIRTYQMEKRYVHQRGHFVTAMLHVSLVRDVQDQPSYFVAHIQDITERKRSEQAIERALHRLTEAQRIGQIGDWELDVATRMITWSPQVFEILGRDPSLGPPRDYKENAAIFDAASSALMEAKIVRAIESGEAQDCELVARRPGGDRVHVHAMAVPRKDAGGNVLGLHGTVQDITARKRTESVLLEQHALLSNAQRVGGMGLWELDVSSNRLLWSEGMHRIFGVAAETFDHTFEAFLALVHPDDVQRMKTLYVLPPSDGSALELEYRIRRPNGEERVVFERGEITLDDQGQPLRKSGLVMDVTERRRDQEELRQLNVELEGRVLARTAELNLARDEAEHANQAKSTFLATMSHEIRTPMNGVIGMLDVLQQTSLQGDQIEMLDLIHESAFSLLGIIEDILDFSKIEAGKLEIAEEPTHLGTVVEKVCGMLDHLAVKQGVRMTMFVDPAIPNAVAGDAGRLRQVLVNLGGNAIKFSAGRQQQGQVSMRAILVERDAQAVTVELSVADNGIGMLPATLARLFTPFSQADASTTRRFGGTGLGLAISKMLVNLMGGEISVRSAPDQGSTFTVRVRLATVEASPANDAEWEVVEGLRCRIVGGELSLADDLGAYLLHAGAIVERSPSLAAAAAATPLQGLSLWLILPGQSIPTLADLRAMAPGEPHARTRFVVFGQGKRRTPRVEEVDLVTIDVDALARRMLFKTLGLASGRVLPDASDDKQDPTADPAPRDDAHRRGRQILVVEDNATNRRVIMRQLQLVGYDAEVCADGREALERWRNGDFALVLTDLRMPEMDGYALATAIRAEEGARRRTPIIALTANALRDEELRCRAVGMDAYLTKPVRLPQLKAALESWLVPGAQGQELLAEPSVCARATAPVDLNVLVRLVGADPMVIEEVLHAFGESAAQLSTALIRGADSGSLEAVTDAAHMLKSGARSIGAMPLGDLCAQIEATAGSRRVSALNTVLPAFETELRAVLRFLDARDTGTVPRTEHSP
jgi:PAS domain S-box-containing protein